ncbi:MAG: hypothetical protein IKI04_01700, partial [Bacilli bacterium]|nr:hypothetical protein [Bacilli bacterium]
KNKVVCICPNWIDSDSTNNMDKSYLDRELERIGQSRLITMSELNKSIYEIINKKEEGIFRIDVKGDKLWVVKE